VSDTLFVYLQEDPGLPSSSTVASPSSATASAAAVKAISPTAPELRVYLSELYGQLWDVCFLHRNLQLDVRIIYNTTATATATAGSAAAAGAAGAAAAAAAKQKKKGGGSNSGGGSSKGTKACITREEALLKPELEVVFARRSTETEQANSRRAAMVRARREDGVGGGV
jgi:hypothetical protein